MEGEGGLEGSEWEESGAEEREKVFEGRVSDEEEREGEEREGEREGEEEGEEEGGSVVSYIIVEGESTCPDSLKIGGICW